MENFERFDPSVLRDMLSRYTNQYVKLYRTGANEKECVACKNMMSRLTREIVSRELQMEPIAAGHSEWAEGR